MSSSSNATWLSCRKPSAPCSADLVRVVRLPCLERMSPLRSRPVRRERNERDPFSRHQLAGEPRPSAAVQRSHRLPFRCWLASARTSRTKRDTRTQPLKFPSSPSRPRTPWRYSWPRTFSTVRQCSAVNGHSRLRLSTFSQCSLACVRVSTTEYSKSSSPVLLSLAQAAQVSAIDTIKTRSSSATLSLFSSRAFVVIAFR